MKGSYEGKSDEEVAVAHQRVLADKARDRMEKARVAKIIKADIEEGHLNRQFSVNPRDPSTWNGPTQEARAQALEATGKPMVAKICPIQRMYDRGRIDDDQHRAATAIVQAVEIITAGLGPSMMRYEERVDGLFNQDRIDRRDDFEEGLLTRYAAWREAMAQELLNFGAIIAVLIDGCRCKDIDERYAKRNGWAGLQVRDALKLYVDVNRPSRHC